MSLFTQLTGTAGVFVAAAILCTGTAFAQGASAGQDVKLEDAEAAPTAPLMMADLRRPRVLGLELSASYQRARPREAARARHREHVRGDIPS
jgi:hypothetical protein